MCHSRSAFYVPVQTVITQSGSWSHVLESTVMEIILVHSVKLPAEKGNGVTRHTPVCSPAEN